MALDLIGQGPAGAGQMAWEVGWALVLGFLLSAIVQAVDRSRALRATHDGYAVFFRSDHCRQRFEEMHAQWRRRAATSKRTARPRSTS